MSTIDSDSSYLGWKSQHFTKYLVFLNNSFQRFMSRRLRKIGVSLSSYPVLLYLYYATKSNMGDFTQTYLAHETGQDKGLLSRNLQKLAEQGYVDISTSSSNRQSKLVNITDKGMKIGNEIREFVHEWEVEFWDDSIPAEEKEACLNAVQRMSSAILENEHYRNA